jgi:hypothetical protein
MSGAVQSFYHACGLSIGSDLPVAGLRPTAVDGDPDVIVSLRGGLEPDRRPGARALWYLSPELDAGGRPEMTIETDHHGYWLTYNGEATFFVDRAGARIVAHRPGSVSDVEAAGYLAGSVLAFVLRLRGAVPLHASAIVVDGQALLFIGDPWAGKSTTIAAFSTIGCPVLADDIVRIDAGAGGIIAYPGHPRLHLWSDSAAALFGMANEGLDVEYEKHVLDLPAAGCQVQTTALPVGAVYVLDGRLKNHAGLPSIERLTPSAAVVALTRHTYGGCFLDQPMRAREFDTLCQLADRVPVRQLRFGDDLAALPASCEILAARHTR